MSISIKCLDLTSYRCSVYFSELINVKMLSLMPAVDCTNLLAGKKMLSTKIGKNSCHSIGNRSSLCFRALGRVKRKNAACVRGCGECWQRGGRGMRRGGAGGGRPRVWRVPQ